VDPASDLGRYRDLAGRAALEGGRVIRGARGQAGEVETKGAGDYVTEVDRASEEAIGRTLREGAPGIPVVGKSSGGARKAGSGRSPGRDHNWIHTELARLTASSTS
jgi:fructose-1,6-bisphosphatase/inositol monophosphatase family enzyme